MASLSTTLWAPKAQACSPPPPPYVMLEDTIPADGATNVATNGVIVVSASGTSTGTNTAEPWLTSQTLSTRMTAVVKAEGSETPVPGEIVSWYKTGALWRATSSLAPSTTYAVSLTVNNEGPVPEGAEGPTTLARTFTTGATALAPLTLTDAPSYAFATEEINVCASDDQFNPCGSCMKYEKMAARVVNITVPELEGGLPEAGYAVTAWMTNGEGLPANTITLNAFQLVTQKAPTALQIVLPEKDAAYDACVHVEIADASGDLVKTEPQCFAAAEVWAKDEPGAGGSAGSGGEAGSAGAGSESGAEDDDHVDGIRGGSCSTSGKPVGAAAGGLMALGLTALLGTRRRTGRRG